MKPRSESDNDRRNALAAFHGKRWTHPPPINHPLHSDLGVPKRYFGIHRAFSLFENWRPEARTVRQLLETELCPVDYQQQQRTQFVLCWSAATAAHSDLLDPGERLYTFTPKETRSVWNDRYHQWTRSAWLKALDEIQGPSPSAWPAGGRWIACNPSTLKAYAQLLERALADPAWLARISDHHFTRNWQR